MQYCPEVQIDFCELAVLTGIVQDFITSDSMTAILRSL